MNFNQYVHSMVKSRAFDLAGGDVVDRCHDDQDAVGAERAGFGDLIRLVDKVFAENGKPGRLPRLSQKLRPALERRRIRQHGETHRAALLVSAGESGWI